ncbi:hypothetical protein A6037_04830 [[Haemophilus] ducreyi]|uniref:FxsA family protein n=1 Tax=Haemophilus ducreyi TaxID=730 RepID=UPI0007CDED72|nr:FxsA family protein [[Haemophilus] ducreyi]ANF62090.1 hypothetical protein A6037_04830 [[Haemophilus] ducreyi]
MPFLFIFFTIIFYIYCEISLLVSISSMFGILPTTSLLISLSLIGLWLVRLRGLHLLYSIQQQLSRGELPAEAVFRSLFFMLAGILLIIPGFLSDILAIFCLLPITRHLIKGWLISWLKHKIQRKQANEANYHHTTQDDTTFDAQFERQQDPDKWIK